MNFAIEHGRSKRTSRGRHPSARPPNVVGGVIFVNHVTGHPAINVAADEINLAVQSNGGGVMHRARNVRAAAQVADSPIIDVEFELAAEPADHVNPDTRLGYWHP